MAVTAQMVQELRKKTGAGMMDCKKALSQVDGQLDQAIDYLRKKGLSDGAKKAGRIASEGLVTSYIHGNGKIGVLLEVNSETDFVARNEDFQNFCKDVAMHIAASAPRFVSRDDVDANVVEQERTFLQSQAAEGNKPEAVVAKMVEGRLGKFFKEICLLEQPFVKDNTVTIEALQNNLVALIGEKIKIRRFVRFQLGEGLEKRQDDFAQEVAAMSKANN